MSSSTAQSGPDAPAQLARRQERAAIGERLQPGGLVANEAHHRRLTGRAMHPLIGDLPRPAFQMSLEGGEALEAAAGDGVALHVADAALVLALGSRPIRGAGPNLKAPVPCEGMELGVQHHLAAGRIVAQDQRTGVVEQHLRRDTAEGRKGALHSGEPVLLALAQKGPHMEAPRVAERRHEERHQPQDALDLHPTLAEVDLQLLTRPRLETHRRPCLGAQLLAQMRHRPLHRAQAHLDALLGRRAPGGPRRHCRHDGETAPRARPPARPAPSGARVATGLRHTPSRSHRRAVVREHPSSAAIRRAPQPSAFSFSIADTSSGSSISSLRRPTVHGSVLVVSSVIQTLLSAHEAGQFLMSPEFVSPDSPERARRPLAAG